jgi:hypothetical protein
MVMLVLKFGSFVTKTMLNKCSMYLTLQRTCLWLCLKKRIVGVENAVEEEYN